MSDSFGKLREKQQRKVFYIVDGVVGGEGDGPLAPNNVNAKQRRHNKSRGANEDNVGLSIGLSGGSPTDNDAAYCTEIARRSVARAALHLGMEGMEGEALDSLGSILLGYMEMVSYSG